ncbi:phosphoribosylformylglycinamidine synthase I [Actinomyces sp. oral taxon 448 str. F0400]|nr:phosphoribosylformylglycinamidine synthase I [Actinomyces sp. oral taxon 448 str. F0400]
MGYCRGPATRQVGVFPGIMRFHSIDITAVSGTTIKSDNSETKSATKILFCYANRPG